jgi:phosphomevalonate kinase
VAIKVIRTQVMETEEDMVIEGDMVEDIMVAIKEMNNQITNLEEAIIQEHMIDKEVQEEVKLKIKQYLLEI